MVLPRVASSDLLSLEESQLAVSILFASGPDTVYIAGTGGNPTSNVTGRTATCHTNVRTTL